jgi:hypothetical protein
MKGSIAVDLVALVLTGAEDGESVFEAAERILIVQALERSFWIQKDAARLLGVTPRVMNYRMEELKIRPSDIVDESEEIRRVVPFKRRRRYSVGASE